MYFSFIYVVGSMEKMKHEYSFDEELNYASNNFSHSKFE